MLQSRQAKPTGKADREGENSRPDTTFRRSLYTHRKCWCHFSGVSTNSQNDSYQERHSRIIRQRYSKQRKKPRGSHRQTICRSAFSWPSTDTSSSFHPRNVKRLVSACTVPLALIKQRDPSPIHDQSQLYCHALTNHSKSLGRNDAELSARSQLNIDPPIVPPWNPHGFSSALTVTAR